MVSKKKTELKELRCSCGKLLAKSNGWIEIKCPRCHMVRVYDNGKLIEGVNEER